MRTNPLDAFERKSRLQLERASKKIFWVEYSRTDGRVSDSRLVPSSAVAHGTRLRPRTLRPDVQVTALVNPSDAAASGSDAPDVYCGREYGVRFHDRLLRDGGFVLHHE